MMTRKGLLAGAASRERAERSFFRARKQARSSGASRIREAMGALPAASVEPPTWAAARQPAPQDFRSSIAH